MRISPETTLSLRAFVAAVETSQHIEVSTSVIELLNDARKTVEDYIAGDTPIYGLNTGLGANLGHRVHEDDIPGFQQQILLGRACGTGDPLAELISKAAVFARILGAAKGYSGMSEQAFGSLVAFYNAGLVPVIPRYGSIGAGDLVLNAHMALALMGKGEVWLEGKIVDAAMALKHKNLPPVVLAPKDAMALINHSCVSAAAAAVVVNEARNCLEAARYAAALSFEGYGGNRSIFMPELNTLRCAKGQAEAASWFHGILEGSHTLARKIQDALSFRVVAPVYGTAEYALSEAVESVEDELNGACDSPVVLRDHSAMMSTANFYNPMIVHGLDGLSMALTQCAHSMVQRVQKLMSPSLSDLPKYLSSVGGGSAGMVPVQKTANSLLAEILTAAQSPIVSVPAVSEAVEDMATLSMTSIAKLKQLLIPFRLLAGIEALVAAQAMDLRDSPGFAVKTQALHDSIRAEVPMLTHDRSLGPEIETCARILMATAKRELP